MIQINDKQNCCGCYACAQKCPKQCITMTEDNEGFSYPVINEELCIDCGLCEKVCPVINQGRKRFSRHVYAINNKNEETRRKSSSGGVFTLFSEKTISEKGVVFGAKFDNRWNVIHAYTDIQKEIEYFNGSKYVQSSIGSSYIEVEAFLRQGRKVLFSGTPCQVAGLKLFLKKEYENLRTIDFVCHGVPSPKIWQMYLNEIRIKKNVKEITNIKFRDKKLGWKNFSLVINFTNTKGEKKEISEPVSKNIYLRGFLQDLYLRPSCHACPANCLKSNSDITLGDYWGISKFNNDIDDNKGTSLVIASTPAGENMIEEILNKSIVYKSTFENALASNPCLTACVPPSPKRKLFFTQLTRRNSISKLIYHTTKITLYQKIKTKIHHILNK